MALKWTGDFDRLKQAVHLLGKEGVWNESSDPIRFNGDLGEVINFWPKTKTVSVQGTNVERLEGELIAELGLTKATLDFDE